MADHLMLEVATPSRLLVGEAVDEVVVPGSEGYFGVLPGHAPFLTTLGIGELTYRQGREERHLAVAGGFAEVRTTRSSCWRTPPSGPRTSTARAPSRRGTARSGG